MKNSPAAPAAVPGEERRRLLWAGGVFVFFLVLFGLSHDRIYYFDGLLQAGMVSGPADVHPASTWYEWNHFLWYPTGRLFFKAVHAVGAKWEGYETLQAFNTLIGAAGAALFFLILSRLAPWPWAAGWTVLSCLGQVYWYRSGGAENHLAGAVWCLAQAWVLLRYWENPSMKLLLGMGATGLLAAYYHLGNFAAWGVAGLAVLLRRPRGKTAGHLAALSFLIAAGWVPYALVHGWLEPGGFSKWWTWSTSLAHGYSPLAGGKGIEWNFWDKGVLTAKTFVKSALFFDKWTWGVTSRLLLLAAGLGAAVFRRPLAGDRRAKAFLVPFAVFMGLYTFWSPGNYTYWIMQWASFCLFLGAWSAGKKSPLAWAGLAAAIGVLAWNNSTTVVLPRKTNPDQSLVDMSREIGGLTPPQSPIVISGRGETILKPYIPYFGRRNRLAMDLFILNAVNQNADPVDWMKGEIGRYLSAGVPVYITEDMLRCAKDFGDFRIAPEKIESVWRPFALLPVRDFPGPRPNRLYLMWTPALPTDTADVMCLRLKLAGLKDQLAAAARLRLQTTPPAGRAAERRRLESLTDLTL